MSVKKDKLIKLSERHQKNQGEVSRLSFIINYRLEKSLTPFLPQQVSRGDVSRLAHSNLQLFLWQSLLLNSPAAGGDKLFILAAIRGTNCSFWQPLGGQIVHFGSHFFSY
jgi:hypothetical protein